MKRLGFTIVLTLLIASPWVSKAASLDYKFQIKNLQLTGVSEPPDQIRTAVLEFARRKFILSGENGLKSVKFPADESGLLRIESERLQNKSQDSMKLGLANQEIAELDCPGGDYECISQIIEALEAADRIEDLVISMLEDGLVADVIVEVNEAQNASTYYRFLISRSGETHFYPL